MLSCVRPPLETPVQVNRGRIAAPNKSVITGFNTDIEYEGVTYHVQTEDKGLDTPLILSLVYVGGAILASKRSPYDDLLASGFDEKVLTERLGRQHKLICAAIRAGRIEDLKKMSERGAAARDSIDPTEAAPSVARKSPVKNRAPTSKAESDSGVSPRKKASTEKDGLKSDERGSPKKAAKSQPAGSIEKEAPAVSRTDAVEPSGADLKAGRGAEVNAEGVPDGLYLNLLGEHREFRAGDVVTMRIHTSRSRDGRVPLAGASITLKVLGTTFRPIILPATTDKEGIAVVRTLLPRFTSGRAAILIRAVADGNEAELRRIIHQA